MLRTFRFASVQARIRARVGRMPGAQEWAHFRASTDIDNLIDRMRGGGLEHWLDGLPRSPAPSVIEHHLERQQRRHIRALVELLPRDWKKTRRWLGLLPDLDVLRAVLAGADLHDPDSPWAFVAVAEPARRPEVLAGSSLRELGAADQDLYDNWLLALYHSLPPASGVAGRMRLRLYRTVNRFVVAQQVLRAQRGEDSGDALRRLEQELRSLLMVADPFHDTLILVYGLLQAIEFLRLRSLLLDRAWSWNEVA